MRFIDKYDNHLFCLWLSLSVLLSAALLPVLSARQPTGAAIGFSIFFALAAAALLVAALSLPAALIWKLWRHGARHG